MTQAGKAWAVEFTQYREIADRIEEAGFLARGGFHPDPSDRVPVAGNGRPAATLILVGNAGETLWKRFSRERDPRTACLDEWTREKLDAIAQIAGARAIYPFTRPHLPFLRWAQKADACFPSPLGLAIHPDYGLWHAFRGALVFAGRIDLPPRDDRQSPCLSCPDRPCLQACPVGAFAERSYDVGACRRHLGSQDGRACMEGGCLARHACPVGREFVYSGEQARFLMGAFRASRNSA